MQMYVAGAGICNLVGLRSPLRMRSLTALTTKVRMML